MNFAQAAEISQAAKKQGYATQAKCGKLRFVVVEFNDKGGSTVTPRTDWLDYEEAKAIVCASL